MKASSIHFTFEGQTDYKDMAPVFPDILNYFLTQTEQVPEDEELLEMFIELNMRDLEQNRKPEGFNRRGKVRMVFPLGRKEFYIRAVAKGADVSRLGEKISAMLSSAGVDHEMSADELVGLK